MNIMEGEINQTYHCQICGADWFYQPWSTLPKEGRDQCPVCKGMQECKKYTQSAYQPEMVDKAKNISKEVAKVNRLEMAGVKSPQTRDNQLNEINIKEGVNL